MYWTVNAILVYFCIGVILLIFIDSVFKFINGWIPEQRIGGNQYNWRKKTYRYPHTNSSSNLRYGGKRKVKK